MQLFRCTGKRSEERRALFRHMDQPVMHPISGQLYCPRNVFRQFECVRFDTESNCERSAAVPRDGKCSEELRALFHHMDQPVMDPMSSQLYCLRNVFRQFECVRFDTESNCERSAAVPMHRKTF
ncbi:unnamed protein product [Adineta ricciae]|uniref:Uncharacterized protein n=1 Tax=Adineta ricciae TaxID=249248 RepID=A0A815TIQ7_ADIRI|nr:unnamed protein product [Adineta ricciae]CAF1654152.1 unnamed protein product [Adineta ricciae]